MFKKTKAGSSFKSGKVTSGVAEQKAILEELGYTFDSVTKKSGWKWSTSAASSEHNYPTEGDVIEDAWRDAGERTQAAMTIPAETWERMSIKEQAQLITEAMSGQ
jgi:hypothetical protein